MRADSATPHTEKALAQQTKACPASCPWPAYAPACAAKTSTMAWQARPASARTHGPDNQHGGHAKFQSLPPWTAGFRRRQPGVLHRALVRAADDGGGLYAQYRRPLCDLHGAGADPAGTAPDGFRDRIPDRHLARAVLRGVRLPAVLAHRPLQPPHHPHLLGAGLVGDDDLHGPVGQLSPAAVLAARRGGWRSRRHAGRELDPVGLFPVRHAGRWR